MRYSFTAFEIAIILSARRDTNRERKFDSSLGALGKNGSALCRVIMK
jgi:hypothetical protein